MLVSSVLEDEEVLFASFSDWLGLLFIEVFLMNFCFLLHFDFLQQRFFAMFVFLGFLPLFLLRLFCFLDWGGLVYYFNDNWLFFFFMGRGNFLLLLNTDLFALFGLRVDHDDFRRICCRHFTTDDTCSLSWLGILLKVRDWKC